MAGGCQVGGLINKTNIQSTTQQHNKFTHFQRETTFFSTPIDASSSSKGMHHPTLQWWVPSITYFKTYWYGIPAVFAYVATSSMVSS